VNAKRLIFSLVVGGVFALLTWFIFGDHFPPNRIGAGFEYLGWIITIVFLPGLFTDIVVSGNVHGGSIVFAVLGNFLFYCAATYCILAIREKRKTKSRTLLQTPQNGPQ